MVETLWAEEHIFEMVDEAIRMFGSYAVCTEPITCRNIYPAEVVIALVEIRND